MMMQGKQKKNINISRQHYASGGQEGDEREVKEAEQKLGQRQVIE